MTREMKRRRIELLNEIAKRINKCNCESGADKHGKHHDCKNCEELRKIGSELETLVRNPVAKKSQRVVKEGVRPKDWTMPVDKYWELKKKKMSDSDIAEMHSVSRDTLKRFKKDHGISRGYNKKEVV